MWKRKLQRLLKNGPMQIDLAKKLGITQGYLSLMARGFKCNPSYELGQKIDKQISVLGKNKEAEARCLRESYGTV